ncbi:asparginase [Aspergillus ellipticus CBS 707.79]|uniref:Asparginase n=1 Tax=Aspergillus ellipticus CBS 707.79 TaxID=1448320 RepID=A0A319D8X2_9EURO|nr:asparginase [Aspergillus ellipticus CBS 707.79]
MSRPKRGGDIAAVFVHAGAGFHAPHNEKLHLETCENAAKVAMKMLNNGGSAVDAVEIAIMLLEDAEITNAGYGSNLNIEGTVECDATIVNHLGRSGAVGAAGQVKNPISVARVVLDSSTKPLSLSRVPPNFLVGQGATDFAFEHGMVVLPEDALVSAPAKERWRHWQRELEAANLREKQQAGEQDRTRAFLRRPVTVHPAQLLAASPRTRPASAAEMMMTPVIRGTDSIDPRLVHQQQHGITPPAESQSESSQVQEVKYEDESSRSPSTTWKSGEGNLSSDTMTPDTSEPMDIDRVNDTVGAIVVDIHGNIAAGSSSGGIGMKHRGRIGPAALVGIGTAVIPADPMDPELTSVAAITSGTGEHIATTMAASNCASRVYYSHRKCKDGSYEEVNEEEAIKAAISEDFMHHPGVQGSHCQGAIGLLSVKRNIDGVFLYFAHNTDSFAIASMCSEDKKPVCVMSRSNGHGSIALGGRACRAKKHASRSARVTLSLC